MMWIPKFINTCILFAFGYIFLEPHWARAEAATSYSRSLPELQTLRTYATVTIATCRQQCKHRQRCHGAVYHKRRGMCTLLSTHFREPGVLPETGSVLLTGFDLLRQNDPLCGNIICGYKETCTTDLGTAVCQITECGQPPAFYNYHEGNMYEVNRTIVLPDTNVTMRCEEDGSWVPGTDDGMFDCSNVTGPSGVYNFSYYSIYCDMDTDGGNWLVFVRRQDGSEYFQRGWTAYELGFGNLTGEFWLGLSLLYDILQSGDFELRADLEDSNGNTTYAKYSSITMSGYSDRYRLSLSGYTGDADLEDSNGNTVYAKNSTRTLSGYSERYRLSLSSFTGNAGDSMAYTNNRQFSAFDQDNDSWGNNCAAHYTCAWWLSSCYKACLTGRYLLPSGGFTAAWGHYVHWWHWRGYDNCLKTAEMKIRRK